jgi:hypothetical protein
MVVPAVAMMGFGTYAVVVRDEAPIGIVTVGDVPPGVGVGLVGIGEDEPPPQPASATTHVRRLARHMSFITIDIRPAEVAGRKCARLERSF